MTLGVVYDPMRDELFSADRGQGARCNGRRLQVSQVTELGRSLLVTGFPYDAWSTPTIISIILAVLPGSPKGCAVGSAAFCVTWAPVVLMVTGS